MTSYAWAILAVITAIILIAVGIWFIRAFYRRSSKEIAFVRTGLGGQKVIIDGAAFVFPIFHDVTEVYLNTLRLSVVCEKEQALISKDRMRVDVAVDFYIRVRKEIDTVTVDSVFAWMARSGLGGATLRLRTLPVDRPQRPNAVDT